MKRSTFFAVLLFSVAVRFTFAQPQPAPDPYKPVLDRLQAITTMPLEQWKMIEADLPHGETPQVL